MSTLTKVLIVLQVVFSIFLCGIVVTYVTNAEDFKEKWTRDNTLLNGAKRRAEQAERDRDEYKEQKDAELAKATADLSALRTQLTTLTNDLQEKTRLHTELTARLAGMGNAVEASNRTALEQTSQFDKAQAELKSLDLANISLTKELKETNDLVIQKMALISTQNEQIKRLTEEKTDLENRIEQFTRQFGKTMPSTQPATIVRSMAQPALRTAPDIGLKGLITDLDLKEYLAEISLGSAHGVKPEDKFFVTRGDQFVCNILVLHVDTDKSVGVLDLVKLTPRVGDKISTNF